MYTKVSPRHINPEDNADVVVVQTLLVGKRDTASTLRELKCHIMHPSPRSRDDRCLVAITLLSY